VKVYFERRKIAKVFMTHVQDFFRKSLSEVCHYLKTLLPYQFIAKLY